MRIKIKDFGPISSADILLKPLTILIGPNSSGKSYSAMLIHTLYQTFSKFRLLSNPTDLFYTHTFMYSNNFEIIVKEFEKEFNSISDNLKRQEGKPVEVDHDFINNFGSRILDNIINNMFRNEIRREFSSNIRELIRNHKKYFQIDIVNNDFETAIKVFLQIFKVKSNIPFDYQISIIPMKNSVKEEINVDNKNKKIIVPYDKRFTFEKEYVTLILSNIFISIYFRILLGDFETFSTYLPAARSGILQAHKALSASIIERASYAGIHDLEIPKMSGVVSDFISSVIKLENSQTNIFKLAKEFESEIINGEIVLKSTAKMPYPEIIYKNQDMEIPLHRTSSTVSELAPIFLYLKHKVRKGSLLIIEEPEAHLHPNNQRILAKYLVRLIRNDVRLLITTHSEYLLEQLNLFIKLGEVRFTDKIYRLGYEKDDFLKSNEISAYVFDRNKKDVGYQVKQLHIDQINGIDSEEFMRVHESLYDDSVKINREEIAE